MSKKEEKSWTKKVLQNLQYILRHKWYVAIECFNMGLYWHAIMHDMSKFLPDEFFPYMESFYGGGKNRREMETAWLRHKGRNPHHWDFWVKGNGDPVPMPEKYVKQMIADWRGMGRQKGFADAPTYYQQTRHRMNLHGDTIQLINKYL